MGDYCSTFHKRKPYEVDEINASMVQESFSKNPGIGRST